MAETETVEKNANEAQSDSKTQAQSVEFPEATESETSAASGNIDILLGMQVPVTVAIGQKDIPVRRLLQLGPGSVLELDKTIGSPVDLYLRDTKFANGEVVVVQDRFAVKIKDVIGLNGQNEQQQETKEETNEQES
ncbi:MAG: FliM/FliN family flagellar motor switch protein [Planctomycetota bacterium]|jgi:flagellar motor switch protein FliN/FliY